MEQRNFSDSSNDFKISKFIRDLNQDILSKNDIKQRINLLLEEVYNGEYRHSYAMIAGILVEIKISSNDKTEVFTCLSENLQVVKEIVDENLEYDSRLVKINKLYDHITLEITRFNYLDQVVGKQSDLINKVMDQRRLFDETTEKLNKDLKDVESLKPEIISIIGIFSAITLAFIGGMTFTSSTLTSINEASAYKVIFISSICGIVIFNTIFCLIYIISKMINKNIFSRCSKSNNDCLTGICNENCFAYKKIQYRLPYVYWINFILISILCLDFVAWLCDLKSLAIVFRGYIVQIPVIVVDILNWSLICLPIIIIICYLGFNFYNKIQR